jgi:hypothetical protein
MRGTLQLVFDKDKGLDMAALMRPSDQIVRYVLAEVIYYPKKTTNIEGEDPLSLREWAYKNLGNAFYLLPSQLKTDFRHADVTIKSPRNMRVGYLEIPQKDYPDFCGDLRREFHIHSVGIKKEWQLIHSYASGVHQWRTFEKFIEDRKGGVNEPQSYIL